MAKTPEEQLLVILINILSHYQYLAQDNRNIKMQARTATVVPCLLCCLVDGEELFHWLLPTKLENGPTVQHNI